MLYLRVREGASILLSGVGCSLGVKNVLFVNGSLKWGASGELVRLYSSGLSNDTGSRQCAPEINLGYLAWWMHEDPNSHGGLRP